MKRSVFSWQSILSALGLRAVWHAQEPRAIFYRHPKWETLEPRHLLASNPLIPEGEGSAEHIWLKAEGNTFDSNFIQNGIGYGGVDYATGVDGQAFSLDGVNDEVRITRKLPKETAVTTYSFWFQRDIGSVATDQNLLAFRTKTGAGWSLVSKSLGALEFRLATSERIYRTLFVSQDLDPGWHFVTLSLNDAEQQFAVQIDGGLDVLQRYRGVVPAVSSGYATLGASAFRGNWFDGRIDDVHIFGFDNWSSRTGIHQDLYTKPVPTIGSLKKLDGSLTEVLVLSENTIPGTRLGQFQLNAFSGRFALNDDSAAAFQIDPLGNLYVNLGAKLDFESKPQSSITVSAKGPNERVVYRNFRVQLLDVNEPITDIAISATFINARAPIGARVASVRAIDPDISDSFRYALVSSQNNSVGLTIGAFSIHPETGVISKSTSQPLTVADAAFIVVATDLAGHEYRKAGYVNIDDSLPSMWPAGNEKQLWISSPVVDEGDTARVKIRRNTSRLNESLTVSYATEDRTAMGVSQTRIGGDYLAKQGTIVFASGEFEKEFEIVTLYDYLNEDLETLLVRASASEFGTVTSAISINNKQKPSLILSNHSLSNPVIEVYEGETVKIDFSEFVENHGPVAYPANRTFEYATTDWSTNSDDYESVQGVVVASLSEKSNFSLAIATRNDLRKEDSERLLLRIKTPWDTEEEIPITIHDNTKQIPKARFARSAEFSNSNEPLLNSVPWPTFLAVEGTQTELGIQLEKPFDVQIAISYQTLDGNASSRDYRPLQGIMLFLPGETWKPIVVQTHNDFIIEPDETFFLSLTTPWQQIAEAKFSIRNRSLPELQVSDVVVVGGDSAAFTLTLTQPANMAIVADYALKPGIFGENVSRGNSSGFTTFQPGETRKTVLIPTAAWVPPQTPGALPTLPKSSDFFLDVSIPWDRDIGRAIVSYPLGYPINPSGSVDAQDISNTFDLAPLYSGTWDYFPNYFTGQLTNSQYEEASLVQSPTNGVAEVYADGQFKYRPKLGYTGQDSFLYKLRKGSSSDIAIVNIQVVNNSITQIDHYALYGDGQNQTFQTVLINDLVVGLKEIQFGAIAPTVRPNILLPKTSDYVDQVCRPNNDSYYYLGETNSTYAGRSTADYNPEALSYPYVICDRHRLFDGLTDGYDSVKLRDRLSLEVFPSGRIQLDAPFVYGVVPSLSIPYEAKLINGFENASSASRLRSSIQMEFSSIVAPPLAVPDYFGGNLPIYGNTSQNKIGNVFDNDEQIVRGNQGVVRDLAGRVLHAQTATDWESRRLLQTVSIPSQFPKQGRSLHGGLYAIQSDGDVIYTPPSNFVGVDYLTYVVMADDGRLGIVGDEYLAHVHAGDGLIGSSIAVKVDDGPFLVPDTKANGIQPYSVWTHTPNGSDTYSGSDQGIYVWNDHNAPSVDLDIDGLSVFGNDVGGAGPLAAYIFYATGNPNGLGVQRERIGLELDEMKGLKFKVPVGFIGDLTLYYRQRNDWNETLNISTVSLSIHGPRYAIPNLGPVFTSTPNEIGFPAELYRYEAIAADPEGQSLTYNLISDEPGLSINPTTGVVQWNVPLARRDPTFVSITAKNTSGKSATQEYWIKIAAANQPPIFTTNPIVQAELGTVYSYAFAAKDPDGDKMVFRLQAPLGWELIDKKDGTGTLTHTVTSSDALGPIMVVLDVSDINGAATTQSFEVQVDQNNNAPIFTSTPKVRFDLAGRDLTPIGDVHVVQPASQANQQRLWFNIPKGDKVNASVRFSVAAAPPKVDVMLLLDDTESFEGPNYLLSTRFLEIANKLKADYPNTDFGFGVSRFEDFKTFYSQEAIEARPFILNQPILDQSYPRFQEVMESALQRANQGHGGFTSEESLIEALYQLASGNGFDGTTNGTTLDDGAAGSLQSQIGGLNLNDVPRSQFVADGKNNFVVDTASKVAYRIAKIGDQPLLPLNQPISGTLDGSLKATIYRFNAKNGDILSLASTDWQSIDIQSDVHLYSPLGQRLEPKSTSGGIRQYTIPQEGLYALVIDREPSASLRSNIPLTEVEYNEAKNNSIDFAFLFTATLTAGSIVSLPIAIPAELNDVISVGPLATGAQREFSFELDSSKLLILKPIQGIGNWTLKSETGHPLRWGSTSKTLVLHATQFSTIGNLAGATEEYSQPGQGGLPAGKYRIAISDQSGSLPIQFQILDASNNSLTLNLGNDVQGRMDAEHSSTFIRFVGRTGQVVSFESADSPSPLAAATLITPTGSEIEFQGDIYPRFQKSNPIRLPTDGEYLLLVSATNLSGPIVPFTFKLKSKIEGEFTRPQFERRAASWNTVENLSVSDLRSHQVRLQVAAGEQVYFDGMNATARVRVDYFDANGTSLFSLKNSELNRMMPVAQYPSDQIFTLEPIDLIASVPRNRVGGGGFRPGALPIVITATDNGSVYRADLDPQGCAVLDVHGVGGTTVDIRNMVGESYRDIVAAGCVQHDAQYDAVRGHAHVPNGSAASVQDAVSALVDIGALVVGVGTGPNKVLGKPKTPGSLLSELARLTGATNSSNQTILNGTVPPNEPLYVELDETDPDKLKGYLLNAISTTLDYAGYDVDVVIRDYSGVSSSIAPSRLTINSTESKTINLELTGDGGAHEFYLEFLRHRTNIVLGRIPIGINYSYAYDADAKDPDGDAIAYSFVGEHHGATIDSTTGEIHWLPDAAGKYAFTVQADDGRGGVTVQHWDVDANPLNAGNHPPTMNPIANQNASVNRPFELQVIAADPDSDSLSFSLIAGDVAESIPQGLTIDAQSGLIRWTPNIYQLGCPWTIIVLANDGRGGEVRRTFQIIATSEPGFQNRRPIISSSPPTIAVVGQRYNYDISASDPDGDPLLFKLTIAPNGMILDLEKRSLFWMPSVSNVGQKNINFQVSDGQGGVTYQSYVLNVVTANQSPEFLNVEPLVIEIAKKWNFVPEVVDANGDVLEFTKVSGPIGLSVTKDGLVTWTPTTLGSYLFALQADDRRGGKTTQQFRIDVLSNVSDPPRISSSPKGPAIIGNLWKYEILAMDPDNDALQYQLLDPPTGMKLGTSANGKPEIQWVPASLSGNYQVQIWVTDDVEAKHGASQKFTLPVTQLNQAPLIRSVPFAAITGSTWTYALNAIDPDGDSLTYQLLIQQPGMTIDPTGVIRWTPTLADQVRFGAVRTVDPVVKIRVTDGHGGEATEEVFTKVNPSPNDGEHPFVANNATGPIYLNQNWTHQLAGIDPDGKSEKIVYNYRHLRKNGSPVSDGGAIQVSSAGLITVNATASNNLVLDDPSYEIVVRLTDEEGSMTDYQMQARFRSKNDWPTFSNSPIGELIPGQSWSFVSTATDPEGNSVTISKTADSVGNVSSSGAVVFLPPANASELAYALILNATDGSLSIDGSPIRRQQATTLIATQHPAGYPRIISHPPVAAILSDDSNYRYQLRSLDSNLSYRLTTGPQGMAIDANGLVTWKPTQFGNFPVVIEVTNASQQTTLQKFSVSAIKPYQLNELPEIVSKAAGPAARDADYSYPVKAIDANGDMLEYSLLENPAWMSIHPTNGKITGVPTVAGQFPVKIRVREVKSNDHEELESTQSFVLTVLQNAPPRITSSPPENATLSIGGAAFKYHVSATDPNFEDRSGLRYSLVDPIDGANITQLTGVLTYSTNDIAQRGKHRLTVRVTDPNGAIDEQSFQIQSLASTNAAPVFGSSPRNTLPAGVVYALELKVSDLDGDDVTYELVDPLPGMRLENENTFVWTPPKSLITSSTILPVSIRFRAKSARDLLTTEQQTLVTITKAVENTAPTFHSIPRKAAIVGFEYNYLPNASDSDNDVLRWKLEQGPSRIKLDPVTGRMTWLPSEADLGSQRIVLAASDGYGGIARQSYSIEVRASNTPPIIRSTPFPYARIGNVYSYTLQAFDLDEDTLTYSISGDSGLATSQGWSLNASTGQLRLSPAFSHGALQSVTIAVRDGRGGQVEQQVNVTAYDAAINKPPIFANLLPDLWIIGGSSQVRMNVNDSAPGSTALTFRLVQAPDGMLIDALTGVITWRPTESQIGLYRVTVRVDDGEFYSVLSNPIRVRTNVSPLLENMEDVSFTGGLVWSAKAKATDTDKDAIEYSISLQSNQPLPRGLSIDASTGSIDWNSSVVPANTTYPLRVTARDGLGGEDSTAFTVTLTRDTTPPTVQFVSNPSTLEASRDARVFVTAQDEVGVQTGSLSLKLVGYSPNNATWAARNQLVALDDQGRATINSNQLAAASQASQIGYYKFEVSAKDTSNNIGYVGANNVIILEVALDGTPPDVEIKSPTYNQIILEPIDILASIDDPHDELAEYWVTIHPADKPNQAIEVKRVVSNKEIKSGVIATVDTTLLDNGLWVLNVYAKDKHSNVAKRSVPIQLDGNYKPGVLSLSFTDLNLNTPDVPLKVQRSYSSSRSNKALDFGRGWALDFGIPKVEIAYAENASPGSAGYPVLLDGTRVTVTLSDGTREGFTFQPYPEHPNLLGINISWIPYFAPDKGNTSFLEVEKTPMLRIANGESSWEYVSFAAAESFHPASRAFGGFWKLYLQSGIQIHVDARTANTAWIEDRNGNRTTITPDGIEHWSSRRIAITRDRTNDNRITSIRDAMNQTVNYSYDAIGNLSFVTDRLDQTISLSYYPADTLVPGKQFLLKSVVDATGREQLLATYTADRRLESLKDVENWATGYSYDIRKREQAIDNGADGAGNDIKLLLDRRGNPVRSVDASGLQSMSNYDKNSNLLEQRFVIGTADGGSGVKDDLVTSFTYNEFGQPTALIDPRGSATRYFYDNKLHQVTSVATADGLSTSYDYDSKGNLLRTTSPIGDKTQLFYLNRGQVDQIKNKNGLVLIDNEYDSQGNLVSVANTDRRVNRFEYDANGRSTANISFEKDTNGGPLEVRVEKDFDPSDRIIATRLIHRTKNVLGQWGSVVQWSTSTVYDPSTGLIRSQTDQRGLRTDYFYDRRGKQIQTRQEVETRVAGPNGMFSSPRVWTSQWTVYDEQGRPFLFTDSMLENAAQPATSPALNAIKTLFDAAGRTIGTQRLKDVVVQVMDTAGAPPTANFSNYHSLRSKVIGAGVVVTSTETLYDKAGRAARTRNENGLWTENYYGFAGDIVQTRRQALDDQGKVVWMVSRSAVDELGRTIVVADSFVEGTNAAVVGTTGARTFFDELGRSYKSERRDGIKLTLLDRYGAVVLDLAKSEGPYAINIDNQGVDANGNIKLISRSLSLYDAQGRVSKTLSGIGPGHPGVETRYEFDERGRHVRQIGAPVMTVDSPLPLRMVTETEYDDQGRAFRTWTNIRGRDVNDHVLLDRSAAQSTTQVYDHLGRAFKSIAPDGSFTLVEFDAWGNVIKETDQGNNTKQNEYDANAQLIAVTLPAVPDPLDSDNDGNTSLDSPRFEYGYNWSGNQTVLQDALGRRTTFAFDSFGRQIERRLPVGLVEKFSYNDRGQQVTHTSFEGLLTEFVYDNGTTNLPTSDPNYKIGSGRMAEQRFYDNAMAFAAGPANASEKWQFTYDAFGRKTMVVRSAKVSGIFVPTRVEQWAYDDRGQLVQESTPEGTINYTYDPVTGQKTRMWTTKSSGLSAANLVDAIEDTRYNYNELGWLTGVTVVEKNDAVLSAAQQEKTTYGHDLMGRNLRTYLPDGVIETAEVNNLGAITRMRHYGPDATPYELGDNPKRDEFLYTYDAGGQRTRMVEKFWMNADQNAATPDTPQQTIYDWAYDADKRLFRETIDSFDNALDRTDSFTLDLFGNRLKRTINLASTPTLVDEVFSYHYDVNDRILDERLDRGNDGSVDKRTTTTWTGTQQASKNVVEGTTPISTQLFAYNLQGRLSSVVTTLSSGPKTRVDYAYDSMSIRISATEFSDSNRNGSFEPSERTSTTEYLIDHNNRTGYEQTIVETTKNAAGQRTKRIAYTFGTDEITQSTTDYTSAITPPPVTSLTFGHDAHGSVRVLFDAAGAIAQAYTYAAYGELLAIHNAMAQAVGTVNTPGLEAQAVTNMLYSGEAFDTRIGQQYLRARWYQPTQGRFDRLDPFAGNASDPLSWNKYGYTSGNPILYGDPTGMFEGLGGLLGSFSIGGAIVGGTIGGTIAAYSGTNLILGILTGAAAGALAGAGAVWAGVAAVGYAGGLGSILMALLTNEVLYIAFLNAFQTSERRQNGPPPSAAKARYDNDYAMLSLDIYNGDPELSQRVADAGWKFDRQIDDTKHRGYSYHSRLYTNLSRGEMVMVYEGSTPSLSHFGDWANNLQQGTGLFVEGWQYEKAKTEATSAVARAKAAGLKIRFAGHSLGGGMATAAALHTGKHATTFNASGVNLATTHINAAARLITNYRVKGEILSTLQDAPIFGWALPNSSAGPTYWLKGRSADPITRHTMDILPGMADFF